MSFQEIPLINNKKLIAENNPFSLKSFVKIGLPIILLINLGFRFLIGF